jgi:hypothetical protein
MSLSPTFTSGMPYGLLPVDPSAVFEPGMICGLIEINGETFATVSNGTSIPPFGIIDDINTTAFRRPVIDDLVFIPSPGIPSPGYGGALVNPAPVMGKLRETNIIPETFASDIAVQLDPKHGVVVIPAGSRLNHTNSNGDLDGFELLTSYHYQVADIPGDSSVAATGLITIHVFRGIYETDQFDTTIDYPLNAPLFCGLDGKLTTKTNGPAVGQVVHKPSALNGSLSFLWL